MTNDQLSYANLAAQPAAYRTGVAYEALVAFVRGEQAALGYTRPQYWMPRHLSKHDISPDGHGMTVPELRQAMREYLGTEDDLDAEAGTLLERGWATRDDAERLWITEAGDRARACLKQHAPAIRDRIHEGIDEADYVTALKVLRRMIADTGGSTAP
ncbi:MarR family transcriptional regulator [Kitasatospora sp. DSM 101779]|uniref:MarR family transcriptional regulator n=1 Tax=Kitasatospora sp. DSM 101779 TaxID=2853165 RepID=UPI0021D94D75|nr:MarR family transcriptional regulator [Kitasatospora sp. DSM 101779]MCU7820549.1 MarR family transcriptional regulator [Kitasatospora sp. DSM 101779]